MTTNNQQIKLEILVDVDRSSPEYSLRAVRALDPTKSSSPISDANAPTLGDVDAYISKDIALMAAKFLLNKGLDDKFGNTIVRIHRPRNLVEVFKMTEEEDEDYESGD